MSVGPMPSAAWVPAMDSLASLTRLVSARMASNRLRSDDGLMVDLVREDGFGHAEGECLVLVFGGGRMMTGGMMGWSR